MNSRDLLFVVTINLLVLVLIYALAEGCFMLQPVAPAFGWV
jgi:hypothetical protein